MIFSRSNCPQGLEMAEHLKATGEFIIRSMQTNVQVDIFSRFLVFYLLLEATAVVVWQSLTECLPWFPSLPPSFLLDCCA